MIEKDDIEKIEDDLYRIRMMMSDGITLLQSLFFVLVSLFLSITILKTTLPIDIESIGVFISSSFLLLGFICLLSKVLMIPFWLLINRFDSIRINFKIVSDAIILYFYYLTL